MMEIIGDILTSSNGIVIAVLFVVLMMVCVRYGNIKVKTDKLTIGKDSSETERAIMRNQIEWCKLSCTAFEQKMPKFEGYDKYRGRYIAEKVFDEMINWIVFNHIEDSRTYIGIKQEIIWNLIQGLTEADEMRTQEFRKKVNQYVEKTVKNLVIIRNEYNKEG